MVAFCVETLVNMFKPKLIGSRTDLFNCFLCNKTQYAHFCKAPNASCYANDTDSTDEDIHHHRSFSNLFITQVQALKESHVGKAEPWVLIVPSWDRTFWIDFHVFLTFFTHMSKLRQRSLKGELLQTPLWKRFGTQLHSIIFLDDKTIQNSKSKSFSPWSRPSATWRSLAILPHIPSGCWQLLLRKPNIS